MDNSQNRPVFCSVERRVYGFDHWLLGLSSQSNCCLGGLSSGIASSEHLVSRVMLFSFSMVVLGHVGFADMLEQLFQGIIGLGMVGLGYNVEISRAEIKL